jgi:hypothetical protein
LLAKSKIEIEYRETRMKTNKKILTYLIIIAIVDIIIPIPIMAIILLYVVAEKPKWFKDLVTDLYSPS